MRGSGLGTRGSVSRPKPLNAKFKIQDLRLKNPESRSQKPALNNPRLLNPKSEIQNPKLTSPETRTPLLTACSGRWSA